MLLYTEMLNILIFLSASVFEELVESEDRYRMFFICLDFQETNQGCGSALIFCGFGSSCFFNADPDPAYKNFVQNYLRECFL